MHELGASLLEEHARIGMLAHSLGIDNLVCIGAPEFAHDLPKDGEMDVHFCETKDEALEIANYFSPGDVVLVKASRAERLEELVKSLLDKWEQRVGEDQ